MGPDDSLSLGPSLTFHHGCLVCTGCGLELEGRTVSLDREDRPHCSPCYERSVVVSTAMYINRNSLLEATTSTSASTLMNLLRRHHKSVNEILNQRD